MKVIMWILRKIIGRIIWRAARRRYQARRRTANGLPRTFTRLYHD
jgi:hypothetical protein